MQHVNGENIHTPRASSLLNGRQYFTAPPPTYEDYSSDKIVNIKSVSDSPVFGDGKTDDTVNINAILSQNAGCSIVYFPAGTYIVTDTIFVPARTRIVGDAFASVISAAGNNFMTASSPKAMVRIGYPGDTDVAQISDMVFSVADILPGCKLVSLNTFILLGNCANSCPG
jgi:glucan 1,3-beta-glucosidase